MSTIRETLSSLGAISFGPHGYWLKRHALYVHASELEHLAGLLAEAFQKHGIKTVVSTEDLPSALALAVGRKLNAGGETVCNAFAVTDETGHMFFPEHFRPLLADTPVLVITDFLADKKPVSELIEACQNAGARVIGLGAILTTLTKFEEAFEVPYRHVLLRHDEIFHR